MTALAAGTAGYVGRFSTSVAVRWSDMDLYGHVNNARVVTLLEEARTGLLFDEAARHGAASLAEGMVGVTVSVRYRRPLVYSTAPAPAALWVSELRAASFALDYELLDGAGDVAVTARTRMAPYSPTERRPRRLDAPERDFLATYLVAEQVDGG